MIHGEVKFYTIGQQWIAKHAPTGDVIGRYAGPDCFSIAGADGEFPDIGDIDE